ncbi:Uncharacterised protein [Mycobacteroides abscessus subsp. abscessus]|nr:Uncharacterised protein [Mycobacteroides abscessus subsp. abscessus]
MTFEDKVGDLRVANQGEFRVPLGFFDEEVKKIPLRYEGDIRLFVAQPFQAAEVTQEITVLFQDHNVDSGPGQQ